MNPITVTEDQLQERTIRRDSLVSCNQAFIDCRTPGSDQKENYALIGSGVSQSSGQYINLREDHGYNIGAAAMPNGVTNSLHMHFTAEVFMNFSGTWLFRWGKDGTGGEYVSHEGDIVSVPTWIFRGFTNVGEDDGWLFTALGRSDTGGIIWGPSVLEDAKSHGLYLTSESALIDTVAGDELPADDALIHPMPEDIVDGLRTYTAEQMRSRITTEQDRTYSRQPFVCSTIPGGRAELAPVIGYGMIEDRDAAPRVTNPHSFNLAWMRATVGEGMLRHWHAQTQVLIVKSGSWRVTLNAQDAEVTVTLHERDTVSVPAGAWREITAVESPENEDYAELVVVNGGDERVILHWSQEVWQQANHKGVSRDADGYVAPLFLLNMTTQDD